MKTVEKPGHTFWQWLFGIIACLGFFIYGLEAAWISPTTKHLQSANSPVGEPLSNSAISWLGSVSCFASAFFVIPFSYSADRFGRKWVVFAIIIPNTISILLRLFVPNLIAMLCARALSGAAASGIFVVIPIYVRELCETNLIGIIGSLNVVFQNAGFLTMYLIGAYLDYHTVLWIYLGFVVTLACLLLGAPESPAYLVKRGKIKKALETVAFLRGLDVDDKKVKAEIEIMQQQEEDFKNIPQIGLKEIWLNKSWRKGLTLLFLIWAVHTWNGSFAIMTYASAILESTGGTDINPDLQSVSFPIVMVIAAFTFTSVAERCGRKPLHMGAYILSTLSYTGLGVAMLLRRLGYSIPPWLPILCMIIAVGTYAGGIRSLPYIICIEIFNFQVRAKVMGMIQTFGWTSVSTQLFAFGPLLDAFGLDITFFLFGLVNILGLYVAYLIPETWRRSEEKILGKLANKVDSN